MERIYNTLDENGNLPMTDEQLSDLGVDANQFDIRTGIISSSSNTSYSLPRVDYREVVDSDLPDSPFFEYATMSEVPGPRPRPMSLECFEQVMFPDLMKAQYRYFTFNGSGFSFNEFIRDEVSIYGWKTDRDTHNLLGVNRRLDGFESMITNKVEFPPDSPSCHEHKGYQCSVVELSDKVKCGDKRPSLMELYAMARLTQWEMRVVYHEMSRKKWLRERGWLKVEDDQPDKDCYFDFPHSVFLMDGFGGCRILQSYFDGKFHVQFSELLDLGHMIAVPAEGQRYFDLVDRKDFLEKINLLLKWAWPLPQGNVVADVPTIYGD